MFLALWFVVFIQLGDGVRVRVVVPKFIRAHHAVTLVCQYDLADQPLYSVKWYRGTHEFFRFVPQAQPQVTAFNAAGINVDLAASNRHQVTLLDVPKHLSGEVTCEVSADGTFSTAKDSATLNVVETEVKRPVLHLSSSFLAPDVKLQINCSAQVTDPPPTLTFYIENNKVDSSYIENLSPGLASLSLAALNNKFPTGDDDTVPIWIRCEATVPGIYHLTSASTPIIPQPDLTETSRSRKLTSKWKTTAYSLTVIYNYFVFNYLL